MAIISYDKSAPTLDKKLQSLCDSIQLALNNISASSLQEGTVVSGKEVKIEHVSGNNVTGTLDGDRVVIKNLDASNIVTGEIDANFIDVVNLNADNITTGELDAKRIDVVNLNADNIVSGSVSADRMKTNVIDAVNASVSVIDSDRINSTEVVTAGLQAGTAEIKQAIVNDLEVGSINGNKITNGTLLAAALSSEAIETLSGNKVYYQATAPEGTEHRDGDTWYKTVIADSDTDKKVLHIWDSTTQEWVASDFDARVLRANTITAQEIASNTITATQVNMDNLQTNISYIGDEEAKHIVIDEDSVDIMDGDQLRASFGAGEAVINGIETSAKFGYNGIELVDKSDKPIVSLRDGSKRPYRGVAVIGILDTELTIQSGDTEEYEIYLDSSTSYLDTFRFETLDFGGTYAYNLPSDELDVTYSLGPVVTVQGLEVRQVTVNVINIAGHPVTVGDKINPLQLKYFFYPMVDNILIDAADKFRVDGDGNVMLTTNGTTTPAVVFERTGASTNVSWKIHDDGGNLKFLEKRLSETAWDSIMELNASGTLKLNDDSVFSGTEYNDGIVIGGTKIVWGTWSNLNTANASGSGTFAAPYYIDTPDKTLTFSSAPAVLMTHGGAWTGTRYVTASNVTDNGDGTYTFHGRAYASAKNSTTFNVRWLAIGKA